MKNFLMNFFKIEEHHSSIKREVIGGFTTFITMAYIIFVNPNILSATGMDKGALITVTCLASFIGTVLAGLWVNVPFAMAPGMGLNAFFTFTLVIGKGATWQQALGVVFLSGIIFLLLTIIGVREKIVNAIPVSLRLAVSAGIGLFITFIGLQGMGLVVDNPATLVGLGKLTTPVILGLIGLVIITVLEIKNVRGSLLIGILATTVLGILTKQIALPTAIISTPPAISSIAFKLDIMGALQVSMLGAIFSFMFVDLFDSVGTIMACAYEAELVKEDGTIDKIGKILEADAIATVVGSLLGTSTTTTYVESSSGIAAGARTGLASIITGLLFLLALIFTPIIGIVPAFATSPALIVVGVYMFKNVKNIDLKDFEVAVPSFITIVAMPLTYSISTGISLGFISYVVVTVAAGDIKKIKPTMWIIALLSLLNFVVTGH
ncbi:MAG: adenine/guanine/hypoxanthine permease [Fusobacteriaceae bacterium]|jgi:AGZA family xanthine/uracil permease-like MFS transporter|nr:Xanthine/uracil/vitamin permease [Fusobacteriales bacterium]MDN5303515.1 adenine/guanine/hypoxanthine permease [Fusobacteriaceae bacterium]